MKDAGTGDQMNAGKVEPITGTVAFVTDSPNPVVLGEVKLNKNGQAVLSTNMLKNVGSITRSRPSSCPPTTTSPTSTSAPTAVTITPTTVNAPTVTSLQAVTNHVETGESITLNATVQNANSSLADGVVEFVTVAATPLCSARSHVGTFGQQVSFTTHKLKKVGTYQIEAKYLPNTNRFAESTSAPITVTVTPLTAASFRVKPVVRHGHLGTPLSFTVTALNVQNQPLTTYTGTVVFTSPTDSWTIFPKSVYAASMDFAAAASVHGFGKFQPSVVHLHARRSRVAHVSWPRSHSVKGGAETLQVTQANNPKVFGKATLLDRRDSGFRPIGRDGKSRVISVHVGIAVATVSQVSGLYHREV